MARNSGKEAEAAFETYWERRGHLVRLWDAADLSGLNGGARIKDFAKPADYLVSSATDPLHFAEVKSTTHTTALAFGCIRKGQSAAALTSAARGDKGFIFYIFSYHLGKWFYMSCTQYAAIVAQGRKSVKFEELEEWHK